MLRALLQHLAGVYGDILAGSPKVGFRTLAAPLCTIFRRRRQASPVPRKPKYARPPASPLRMILHYAFLGLQDLAAYDAGCKPCTFFGLAVFGLRASLFDLFCPFAIYALRGRSHCTV